MSPRVATPCDSASGDALDATGSQVSATVGIGTLAGGGFGLSVEIDVHLPKVPDDRAQQLAEAAHAVCPYSNAVRGNVEVAISVV